MNLLIDIIEEVKRQSSPIGKPYSPDRIISELKREHQRLCEAFPLYTATYEVSLVENVREYALSPNIMSVLQVEHVLDSSVRGMPLKGRDLHEVVNHGHFSSVGSLPCRPYEFWISSHKLCLPDPPDIPTDTLTGYPKLVVMASVHTPLFSGNEPAATDTIPASMSNGDVYIFGILVRFAESDMGQCPKDNRQQWADALTIWRERYREAVEKLDDRLMDVNHAYRLLMRPRERSAVRR